MLGYNLYRGIPKTKEIRAGLVRDSFFGSAIVYNLHPNMAAFAPCYRKIVVYNICLISISDTVSDGATKTLVLNIERSQHD